MEDHPAVTDDVQVVGGAAPDRARVDRRVHVGDVPVPAVVVPQLERGVVPGHDEQVVRAEAPDVDEVLEVLLVQLRPVDAVVVRDDARVAEAIGGGVAQLVTAEDKTEAGKRAFKSFGVAVIQTIGDILAKQIAAIGTEAAASAAASGTMAAAATPAVPARASCTRVAPVPGSRYITIGLIIENLSS